MVCCVLCGCHGPHACLSTDVSWTQVLPGFRHNPDWESRTEMFLAGLQGPRRTHGVSKGCAGTVRRRASHIDADMPSAEAPAQAPGGAALAQQRERATEDAARVPREAARDEAETLLPPSARPRVFWYRIDSGRHLDSHSAAPAAAPATSAPTSAAPPPPPPRPPRRRLRRRR